MNNILPLASKTPPGPRAAARCRAPGFSLIELMVTVAVLGIIASLAAPALTKMVASNRVQSEASSFAGDLMLARTEAVKRGQGVSVCASADGLNCLGTNTWQSGWVMFSDPNQCNPMPTAAVTPLRVRAALKGGDTLVASGATSSCVSFNREGFSNLGAKVEFKLHTSDSATLATRCIAVDLAGRITTQTTASDASCT